MVDKILKQLELKKENAKRLIVEPPHDSLDQIQNDISSGYIACCDEIMNFIAKEKIEFIQPYLVEKDYREFTDSGIKQSFLNQLVELLQKTEKCSYLESMELSPDGSCVFIHWKFGGNLSVNVERDSTFQMIVDVLNKIMKG